MITELGVCADYDMSYRSIAIAHTQTSTITIIPLIGDRHFQSLKFDDHNQKYITYSHHVPPHHSSFMPAAIAKRFMSISHDGKYLAISWLPLNVDAEMDPSKTFVMVYKTDKYKNSSSHNTLLRSFEGDKPDFIIRFQGGCSFMPDGRLALINDTHLCIFVLREHNGELEGEESYKVDFKQDLDDEGVSRSDFYDDLPEIKHSIAAEDLNKVKKSVSFKDLSDTDASSKEEPDTMEIDNVPATCNNDIFYEATQVHQQCDTLDEEEMEIITENELNSDDDFVYMKNVSTPEMKEIISSVTATTIIDEKVETNQVSFFKMRPSRCK